MARFALVVLSIFLTASLAFGQTASASSPQAVSLLQQSLAAMTNGVSVSDVTLSGTVTRIVGTDDASGQAVLEAKGTQESKLSLSLSGSDYSEVRNFTAGAATGSYSGPDGVVHAQAFHNCFTDAAWFFPPLSSIASALGNASANTSYVGQETVNGLAVQHVRLWLSVSSPDTAAVTAIAHLSAIDWYLDSTSALPLVVRFTTHPPDNSSVDIPVEIRFAQYQRANGVLLPFHIQKLFNGGLMLDLTISSATINSGLPDSDFN
jgi:hypothetical protein